MKGNLGDKKHSKRAAFDVARLRAGILKIKDKKDNYGLNKAVESLGAVVTEFVDASAGPIRKVAERIDSSLKACNMNNNEDLSKVVDDATIALHAAIDEGCKPLHEAADSIELSLSSVATAIFTLYKASRGNKEAAKKIIDDSTAAFVDTANASIIVSNAPLRALLSAADAALNAIQSGNRDVPLIVLAAELVDCIRHAEDEVEESLKRMADLLEATVQSATTTVHVNDSHEIAKNADQPIPMEEMDTVTTPWKRLLIKSLHSNSLHGHPSTFFQLATVSNGLPANRTMYFREFQDATDKIQIHADSRSHKIEDLKQLPSAEYRIKGEVDVIDATNSDPIKLQQRDKAWSASRLEYLGPNPRIPSLADQLIQVPSSPDPLQYIGPNLGTTSLLSDVPSSSDTLQYMGLNPGIPSHKLTQVPSSLDPSAAPVEAFCLLVLDPNKVDYLNFESNERITFLRKIADDTTFWTSDP